jgi:signal recognition particle subunit SRP19
MMERQRRVIWPAYIDGLKTRKQGRVLAKKDSVRAPGVKEILRVAAEMGLKPSSEDEKMYPRGWWEQRGCVLIESNITKREALRQIAHRIKNTRPSHEFHSNE